MKKYLYFIACLFVLAACQPTEQARVFGRYVPERKDDFAWENEYAAFRMYGPALLSENPSNGVDLWLKASPELVVDSFYYREHVLGLPYHINYGKGLDCYKVAHTVGCGGLAVVADSTLYVGGPYSSWEILEQTPTKLVFKLIYDSLLVCEQIMNGSVTITAEAGKIAHRLKPTLIGRHTLFAVRPLTPACTEIVGQCVAYVVLTQREQTAVYYLLAGGLRCDNRYIVTSLRGRTIVVEVHLRSLLIR